MRPCGRCGATNYDTFQTRRAEAGEPIVTNCDRCPDHPAIIGGEGRTADEVRINGVGCLLLLGWMALALFLAGLVWTKFVL